MKWTWPLLVLLAPLLTAQSPRLVALTPVRTETEIDQRLNAACLSIERAADKHLNIRRLAPRVRSARMESPATDPALSIFQFVVQCAFDAPSSSVVFDVFDLSSGKWTVKDQKVVPKSGETASAFHERLALELFRKIGVKVDASHVKRSVAITTDARAYDAFHQAQWLETTRPDSSEKLYREALAYDPRFSAAAVALSGLLASRNRATEAVSLLSAFGSNATVWRQLGDLYFYQLNDLKSARKSYQEAMKLDSRDDPSITQLGVLAYLDKNYDLAKQYANQSLSVKPEAAPALNLLGNLAMVRRDTVSAKKMYEKAAAADPFEIIARKNLARIYEERDAFEEAGKIYREILRAYPREAMTYLALANLDHHLGRQGDAALNYCMAILLKPELESAAQNPVQILQFLTRNRRDLKPLEMLATAWEDSLMEPDLPPSKQSMLHATLGYLRVTQLGQPSEAVTDLQIAVSWSPEMIRLHWLLGEAYFQMKQYPKALEYFRHAADRANDSHTFARIHLWLGKTLIKLKRYEDAQLEILKSIHISPNAESYLQYALVLRGLQQFEPAIAQLEKALRLYPAYLEGHLEIGRTCLAARKYDRAMQYLGAAITLDSTYVPAHQALSEVYLTLERFDDAESQIRSALRLAREPVPPEIYSAYGNILAEQKRFDEAYSWYDRHWKVDSTEAQLAYRIAVTFGGRSDLPSTMRWLQKAFEMQFSDFAAVRRHTVFKPLRQNLEFERMIQGYEDAFQRAAIKRLKPD